MKIVVANWKMNHDFYDANLWLDKFLEKIESNYDQIQNREIVVCPSFVMLDYMDGELMSGGFERLESIMNSENKEINEFSSEDLTDIVLSDRIVKLGAQDCYYEESGSFTGDVSASMLKKTGCEYVILGHSERRSNHGETSEIISKKAQSALKENIVPIICVGEDKETRDDGKHLEFVYKQIMSSIPHDVKFTNLVVAYEPIWSIGTGIVPTDQQIAEMAKLIKKIFNEKFSGLAERYFTLYGGSVTSQNSKEILSIPNIDGLLVGKASLDADEFWNICAS